MVKEDGNNIACIKIMLLVGLFIIMLNARKLKRLKREIVEMNEKVKTFQEKLRIFTEENKEP